MNIQRIKNTKKEGVIEFLVYKDKAGYTGVCLTFDIVEQNNDPSKLMKSLKEAAELHLETVIKNNLSDDLLNRYTPKEYWNKYLPIISPYHISLTMKKV
jgi:predicted RNase H-like HicB family nuclease